MNLALAEFFFTPPGARLLDRARLPHRPWNAA
jgi:hypothetical protein